MVVAAFLLFMLIGAIGMLHHMRSQTRRQTLFRLLDGVDERKQSTAAQTDKADALEKVLKRTNREYGRGK